MPPVKYPFVPGQKINRLTTLAEAVEFWPVASGYVNKTRLIVCRCDCGKTVNLLPRNIHLEIVKSCGCLNRELTAKRATKHGLLHAPGYKNWACMRNRCRNPNHTAFHRYGGRGITVCDRWSDFANFYADMGPRPSPKHSIDRIDNDGNYEPSNCRWATKAEQSANFPHRNGQNEKTHCKHGHEFSESNTHHYTRNGRAARSCKACNLARYHQHKQARVTG